MLSSEAFSLVSKGKILLLPHIAMGKSKFLMNFLILWIGRARQLALSGTKECVDHVGLSPPVELLKDYQLSKAEKSQLILLNSLLTALVDHMETKVVMEDTWMRLFGTSLIMVLQMIGDMVTVQRMRVVVISRIGRLFQFLIARKFLQTGLLV